MKVLTFDCETDGFNKLKDKLVLVAYKYVVTTDNPGLKLTLATHGQFRPCDSEDSTEFRELLKNPNVIKQGHNVVFDAGFLAFNGYKIVGPFDDTRILAYLNNPFESTSLKDLVVAKLHKPVKTFKSIQHRVGRRLALSSEIDPIILGEYNMDDVTNTIEVSKLYTRTPWYVTVEQPLIDVLFRMEQRGIQLDIEHLTQVKEEYDKEIKDLEALFPDVNLRSPVQVKELLEKAGYSVDDTSKHTLKELMWASNAGSTGVAGKLLRYRELSKLCSTYLEPLLTDADSEGRIHGSINQAGSEEGSNGTKTGRLTSQGPNLQNIPDRTKDGKKIRQGFIATPGYVMFDSDLKQIEPRMLAHYSQSPKLIKAYQEGLDTHGMFASDIFGRPIDKLTKLERFIGKTSWLASVYGSGYKKLKFIAEINATEKLPDELDFEYFKNVQANFWSANPELYTWRKQHIERTRRCGYITTYGGRTIRIPNINSANPKLRMEAERMCVNYLIQGSSSDIMKMILLRTDKELQGKGWILSVIHDELLGELNDPSDLSIVHNCMVSTCKLNNVPIDADSRIIQSWDEK